MANLKVVGALIVVLAIDLMLFFGQTASSEIAKADPSYDGNTFLNTSSTWTNSLGTNQSMELPDQSAIEGGDRVVFTDMISVSKSWISSVGEYFTRIVGGPVNYLKALNLPYAFTFGIGAFWYGLTFFLIVAWILGKE